MGKDIVIPSGALGGVESLAYFFAAVVWVTLSVGSFGGALIGGPRRLAIGGLSRKECDGLGFCLENAQT